MFVAMNRLTAPSQLGERVEHGFAQTMPGLKDEPGFVNFRLLRVRNQSDDEVLYIAETTWQDEASYEAWTKGSAFARAHGSRGTNSPMKAVLELFDVVHNQEK